MPKMSSREWISIFHFAIETREYYPVHIKVPLFGMSENESHVIALDPSSSPRIKNNGET